MLECIDRFQFSFPAAFFWACRTIAIWRCPLCRHPGTILCCLFCCVLSFLAPMASSFLAYSLGLQELVSLKILTEHFDIPRALPHRLSPFSCSLRKMKPVKLHFLQWIIMPPHFLPSSLRAQSPSDDAVLSHRSLQIWALSTDLVGHHPCHSPPLSGSVGGSHLLLHGHRVILYELIWDLMAAASCLLLPFVVDTWFSTAWFCLVWQAAPSPVLCPVLDAVQGTSVSMTLSEAVMDNRAVFLRTSLLASPISVLQLL